MRTRPSPNHNERAPGTKIDTLVLHYTGMQSGQAALDRLCDEAARVSSHYLLEEDGTLWQLVPDERRAWHAGPSFWRGHTDINSRSIGIEIVNPGHEWGYRPFPPIQMDAVIALCTTLLARHPIPARNVLAHSDIAPDRKQDPGELFDFSLLARHGIGLFPDIQDLGTAEPITGASALAPLRTQLATIGYDVAPQGPWNHALGLVLAAFQRHWRPESITARADAGTRARASALVRLLDATMTTPDLNAFRDR
ncbi:MAG TPA: N-acetylmuramoyl-L-alanine amidase [Acetobacteraceae bacterium]|nr:N-acetylmuramoyl-L-alanine amidase [Acetobacteraceae bacterium]